MYILLGTPMLVAYFGTRFAYKRFFNKDFQLLIPAGSGKKRSKK
jgi:ABC-type iron transport system FetAB permease component